LDNINVVFKKEDQKGQQNRNQTWNTHSRRLQKTRTRSKHVESIVQRIVPIQIWIWRWRKCSSNWRRLSFRSFRFRRWYL